MTRVAEVPAVELTNIAFAWKKRGGFTLAIDHLSIAKAERLLLVGPSGSGKSTLLGLICGTLVPQAGSVSILGHVAVRAVDRDLLRAEHIGVIFQLFNLIPYLSVLDNVLLPLSFAPQRRARANLSVSAEEEARRLLQALGLDAEQIETVKAAELSVGQQQRVAAARALIGSPEIVVADEPTSALDRDLQDAFLQLLFREIEARGATLLMVSHEERFARSFDRVIRIPELMSDGSDRAEPGVTMSAAVNA